MDSESTPGSAEQLVHITWTAASQVNSTAIASVEILRICHIHNNYDMKIHLLKTMRQDNREKYL